MTCGGRLRWGMVIIVLFLCFLCYGGILKWFEIKNHEPSFFVGIFLGEEFKTAMVAAVKSYGAGIGIDGKETAACAVAVGEGMLDKIDDVSTYALSAVILRYSKSSHLYGWIVATAFGVADFAVQPVPPFLLFGDKAYLIVQKAEIRHGLAVPVVLNQISDSEEVTEIFLRIVKKKAVKVVVPAIKRLYLCIFCQRHELVFA